MRRSAGRVPALAAVGFVAVLTVAAGCTDSPVGGPEDQAGGGSVEAFCDDFAALDERFSDPSAQPTPEEVVDALDQIDAPDDIAEDFATFTAGFAESDQIDPADPAAAERIAELQAASTAITDFRTAECDSGAGDVEG